MGEGQAKAEAEAHRLRLLSRRLHRLILLRVGLEAAGDAGRPRGGLSGARVAEHLRHEFELRLAERVLVPPRVAQDAQDVVPRHPPLWRRVEEREVEEVDGLGAAEEEGGDDDDEHRR